MTLYLAGLTCLLFAFGGCSTTSGAAGAMAAATGQEVNVETQVLEPSQVHENFKFLDEDNPFKQDETKVEYVETGSPEYDDFFKKSAKFHGKLVLTDQFLGDLNAMVENGLVSELVTGETLGMLASENANLSMQKRQKITAMMLSGKTSQIPSQFKSISKEKVESVQKQLFKEYPKLERIAKMYMPMRKTLKAKKLQKTTKNLLESGQKLTSKAEEDFSDNKARAAKIGTELTGTIKRIKDMSERTAELPKKFQETMTSLKKAIREAKSDDTTAM